MYRFKASITLSALATLTEETLTITETRNGPAQPGDEHKPSDIVVVSPTKATVTASPGLVILHTWIDSPGVIKVRVRNSGVGALTPGAVSVNVVVLR